MAQGAAAKVSALGSRTGGVFRGTAAIRVGVTRRQLDTLRTNGVIVRELPDTFRMTSALRSAETRLWAALLWAGHEAMASGASAGRCYAIEGVVARTPEIAAPRTFRGRADGVRIHRVVDARMLMARDVRGMRVTGPEATLVRLAHLLDDEPFEIACEDARRRQLTSVPALSRSVERHGRPGRPGIAPMRALLRELDPVHPSRSTLEVKTRRLLVAHGLADFVREFPLGGYLFDFAFLARRTILETNGRAWHDDPSDFEHDQEKWSVPGRHGFKLVLATWDKVTKRPSDLVAELRATLAA